MKNHLGFSNNNQTNRSPRINCILPVEIDGAEGKIKDISATGFYLELDDSFKPNSYVKLSFDLETPGGFLNFDLTGEIVRMVEGDGIIGVGVKIANQNIK